ncbi:helix-turn-helix transcriptional regulator [Leptothoe spongobia]|uniref:WYL domain-containing protein n=1 Tax=Leptothoe spongobia TAU-MAC 1115 TaxID=1967444 RepID=A0A947DCL4_9CYAN|nr:WYL domain-containing protein [Leptothoe spongobia]MBT9314675.1 WYL domain-containing protein [Leptothoe spongobia TAU-MAC 1115]
MPAGFNQLKFAIAILQKLAEKPYFPRVLSEELYAFLEGNGQSTDDVNRKVGRMIAKMRDCGFEIRSAPNRPYELVQSSFPVILTPDQREALALAAYILEDMGFSSQASQILQISGFEKSQLPSQVKVNFSPPVDYGEDRLDTVVQTLQDRFQKRRRYTIRYRSSSGKERPWDLDRSELRLHNGVLYLFAYAPDFSAYNHDVEKNQIFRVDRILTVGAASNIPWGRLTFPAIDLTYRMAGPLGRYQPRRANETVIKRDSAKTPQWVEISTKEESLFWFRQRLLQYGENIRLLTPEWFVKKIAAEMLRSAQNYQAH